MVEPMRPNSVDEKIAQCDQHNPSKTNRSDSSKDRVGNH